MTAPEPSGEGTSVDPLLAEQLAYYRARAGEYDRWWFRQGRYDRGPEHNAAWFAEGNAVAAALAEFAPTGSVLELACGTGLWSARLLDRCTHLTVVDGSPEMLALHAARLPSPRVRRIEADLFAWEPDGRYDAIFFGFWLSHVPAERFAPFWSRVRNGLAPGGRVFFVDSRREPTSTAADHRLPEPAATTLVRKLDDGREYRICKIFREPGDLVTRLRTLGWDFEIRSTEKYFVYGSGNPVGEYETRTQ